jgi:NTE family protein
VSGVESKRVALALGSGGARGYAHVGVIQVLEERGYEVVGIAGSSMGALVGGLYAAGELDGYVEWAVGLSRSDLLRMLDLSLSAPGAIRAEKIFAKVQEMVGDVRIEDLPMPYTAVATDLLARKEVWFQRGPLDVAIRASIAIPSVITPVVLNGRLLADGGLMNPVPMAPTASVRADLTLAVSLNGESRTGRGLPDPASAPDPESSDEEPVEEWGDRFRRGAARLLDRDVVRALTARFGSDAAAVEVMTTLEADAAAGVEAAVEPGPDLGELPAGLGKFDVMNLSIESMQSVLTRYCLAGLPPDVLVSVPKDACRSLDFHRAAEMVELGRELAEQALRSADL